MAIKATITIVGNRPPVVNPQAQQPSKEVKSFADMRKKAEPVAVSKPVVEEPKPVVKPLVKTKIINTVYSDKLDVSKPSKYTEHFLK